MWKGEESTVLLRPALRSTASPQTVLQKIIDPSPSSVFFEASTFILIPQPLAKLLEPVHHDHESFFWSARATLVRGSRHAQRDQYTVPIGMEIGNGSETVTCEEGVSAPHHRRWVSPDAGSHEDVVVSRRPNTLQAAASAQLTGPSRTPAGDPTAAAPPSPHRSCGGSPPRAAHPDTGRGDRRA